MSTDGHWTQERVELIKCYPGKGWEKKVMKMPDSQVHTVLASIRNRREKAKKEGKSA